MMRLPGRRVGLLVAGVVAVGALAFALYLQFGRPARIAAVDYRDADTVALGKEVYAKHCASCHGSNLEGQPNWRQRRADGRLPAPPHDETGHTWHHIDRQLFELTKYGPAALLGGNYESDMQGYEGVLTDREILAVLAFIKSTWPSEIRERHDEMNRRTNN